MNNGAISAFPPSAEKKRMIDFLCLAIMCIGHQSIKYSLLRWGYPVMAVVWRRIGLEVEATDFSLIIESHLNKSVLKHD